MEKLEYRVVWEREGLRRRKVKRYATKAAADRFMVLLGPEPWKALGKEPDAMFCCTGYECGCDGLTVRAQSVESRTIGQWVCREPRQLWIGRRLMDQQETPMKLLLTALLCLAATGPVAAEEEPCTWLTPLGDKWVKITLCESVVLQPGESRRVRVPLEYVPGGLASAPLLRVAAVSHAPTGYRVSQVAFSPVERPGGPAYEIHVMLIIENTSGAVEAYRVGAIVRGQE